jgi:hypothetical protein
MVSSSSKIAVFWGYDNHKICRLVPTILTEHAAYLFSLKVKVADLFEMFKPACRT